MKTLLLLSFSLNFLFSSFAQAGASVLSSDQQIFESQELNGGSFTLDYYIPKAGKLSNANYDRFQSSSSGGLTQSPSRAGPQIQFSAQNNLNSGLWATDSFLNRVLVSGQVKVITEANPQKVSYIGNEIQIDTLDSNTLTVLTSVRESNFREVSLSGRMGDAPNDLLALIPIPNWIAFHNFKDDAAWLPGSTYIQKTKTRVNDTLFVEDCLGAVAQSSVDDLSTTPCGDVSNLEALFPLVRLSANGHVADENNLLEDGTIQIVQGLRMWIARDPIPRVFSLQIDASKSFRVFYEQNGKVYMGHLERDGTLLDQQSVQPQKAVDYFISFNQSAIQSFQNGLITDPAVPGTTLPSPTQVTSADLFGLGGHGESGALSPQDLRGFYRVPEALTGTGMTIAIFNIGGVVNWNDLNAFSKKFGLPEVDRSSPWFSTVNLGPVNYALSGEEATLDVEMIHAIAPGAKVILVTSASLEIADELNAMNVAASLPGVTAVSMSFSLSGDYAASADEKISEDAKLAKIIQDDGVSLFAASGDSAHLQNPGYPATSPYVTAVGGTRIRSLNDSLSAKAEIAWVGSTGGFDPDEMMPPWQANFLSAPFIQINQGKRAIPDVSAVADFSNSPVSIFFNGSWVTNGGTSASAPIWAGISALLGEYLAKKGKSLSELVKATPGGFNGLLYQKRFMEGDHPAFQDIISGSNNLTQEACVNCEAGPGYDDVTGLGSPNVENLLSHF